MQSLYILSASLLALPSLALSEGVITDGIWKHVTTRDDRLFVPKTTIATPRATIEIYENEGRYELWQEKRLFPGLAVMRRVARGIDGGLPATACFTDARPLEWQAAGSAAPKRRSVAPSLVFGKLM